MTLTLRYHGEELAVLEAVGSTARVVRCVEACLPRITKLVCWGIDYPQHHPNADLNVPACEAERLVRNIATLYGRLYNAVGEEVP